MTAASAAAAESFGDTYLYAIAEVLQREERIGLGFFLAKHIIATCSHVVHDAGADLRVRIPGGTRATTTWRVRRSMLTCSGFSRTEPRSCSAPRR